MLVIDPVCGMNVDLVKAAATETVAGRIYYFCSASCHDSFRTSPERYVGNAVEVTGSRDATSSNAEDGPV